MIRDEDKWPAIHAYRKACAAGEAPVIRCPDCDAELVPVVGSRDEPELKCLAGDGVFSIGLDTWDQIEANIREINKNMGNTYE